MAVVSPARFREDSLDVGALGAEAEQRGQQQKRGPCCPCLGTRRRREGHGDRRQWPGKAGEDLGQPMLEVRRRGEGPDSPAGVQLLVEQPLRGYGSLAVVEDARPQQVPDVGGQAVDLPFVAVESEGVAAALVDPEVAPEVVAEVAGTLLEPLCEQLPHQRVVAGPQVVLVQEDQE
jgi:hypothetical protein